MVRPVGGSRPMALFVAVGLVAAGAGYGLSHLLGRAGGGHATPSAVDVARQAAGDLLGAHRPEFSLPDLDGDPQSISRWKGQVILVNFWATWCPPCRREIPEFVEVYGEHRSDGFVVVGVAVDEREAVRRYVEEMRIPYPQLWGDADAAELSERYGNRYGALPYSVLIDRSGVVRYIHPGELRRGTLESELSKLL